MRCQTALAASRELSNSYRTTSSYYNYNYYYYYYYHYYYTRLCMNVLVVER